MAQGPITSGQIRFLVVRNKRSPYLLYLEFNEAGSVEPLD